MTRSVVVAGAVFLAMSGLAVAQDLEAGERSFRKCLPCHAVGEEARHKIGPFLNGLEGRKAGTIAGYNYSEPNKNSGIVWSTESFAEYIKDPRARIPGTKMVFPGVKNEKEIGDLWAYLRQFDAEGKIKPK